MVRYNVLVKEVMKKDVKSVKPTDNIAKAARIMKNNKIGSVLVMEKDRVLGILTSSDIVYKYVASKKRGNVRKIMSTNVVTISPKKTIEDAAELLADQSIEKLPIMDKGKLVGIITSSDILKVEPALFQVLLENMKIKRGFGLKELSRPDFDACENCGNYTDDLEDVDGQWLCDECKQGE